MKSLISKISTMLLAMCLLCATGGSDAIATVTGSISGVVTDEDGNTISGVWVTAHDFYTDEWGGNAQTDGIGSYIILGLVSGEYRVDTWAPGRVSKYYDNVLNWEDASPVPVNAPNDTPNIDFTLEVAGSISGYVYDANGNPIADLHVYATDYETGEWRAGTNTNDQGSYTLGGLPTADYKVGTCAWCSGLAYLDEWYDNVLNWGDATPVSVNAPNDTPDINFSLEIAAGISVSITGNPDVGLGDIKVVLHDSSGKLIDFRDIWHKQPGYMWGDCFNVLREDIYTLKIYDPFLRYQYAEGNVNAFLGNIAQIDFQLADYLPSGVNTPTIDEAMAFVIREGDDDDDEDDDEEYEFVHLRARISDDSGCQIISIKNVIVEDPGGNIHYLHHEKFEGISAEWSLPAESWYNSHEDEFRNFAGIVGDYKFTVIDTEGNKDTFITSIESYEPNKLPVPVLNELPELVDPNAPLRLSWQPVVGAQSYGVLIDYFEELLYTDLTQNTYIDIPGGTFKAGVRYCWAVIAFDADLTSGESADYASFEEGDFSTISPEVPPAEPLKVQIVPWVPGFPLTPHDTYGGRATTLKAVAKGGMPPYTYTWDFRDGSNPVTDTTDDPYNLEAFHWYGSPLDGLYEAKITVTCDNGETAEGMYHIRYWADASLDIKVNVAIDDALWWLHKRMERFTCDGTEYGALCPYDDSAGITALALQAWLLSAHHPSGDPENPYVEDTIRAKNFILNQLYPICIAPETVAGITRDPDSNGNGTGLYVKNGHRIYETGLVLMALATLKDPNMTETIQELVDYLAYAQVEPDVGGGRGGWRYDTNYRESDMSVTQFPLMGLEAAECHFSNYGVVIPSYVKSELKDNFLYFVQNKRNGGFGYSWPNHWLNVAKTGAGLIGLALTGIPYDDIRTTSALDFIDKNWDKAMSDPDDPFQAYYNIGDFYAMYAVMKGMKSYERIVGTAQTQYIGSHDWYDEYAAWEIENQNPDGSWESPVNPYDEEIDTAFGVLILRPHPFVLLPVADAGPDKPNCPPLIEVNFDASRSYHMDPAKEIVLYQWDFNADDGIDWHNPDYESPYPNAEHAFPAIYDVNGDIDWDLTAKDYTVTLRVLDNSDPVLSDTDECTVHITGPPWPPVADPDGPYTAKKCEVITLDGSGSYDLNGEFYPDPDHPWHSYLVSWEWDLDNDGEYDDARGETVEWSSCNIGLYVVGLKVTNSVGDSAAQDTVINVIDLLPNQPPDCSGAYAEPGCLWPPNHKMVSVSILGVTDPDGDPVRIIVTGITSDETTATELGAGGPKHSPDAKGVRTDTALLRAERSGRGNGRVYVISFTAIDAEGAECEGSVEVKVPHDQRLSRRSPAPCEAIDDGQNYDATQIN